ncbi:MAG: LD-carboxypeptidase [Synechococcaceae bacterium WB8_1B_136]|nr:LD-carboxypeptidase [Synechococcaceae bacterium WB8_1B_136]
MSDAWPRPLRSGDRVRLVAASSALDDLERLAAGVAVLESWGLQVDPHPEPLRRWGYLAGADDQRQADLQGSDPSNPGAAALKACMRGGWGAARLLEPPQPVALANGWLLGFSDVTSLLWAQRAQGRCGGIHGPLLTTLAAEPDWSQERLRQLLFGEAVPALQGEIWCGGMAEGPLLVGNLTVATHLLGTPHLPPLAGAVLVLEDVGEAPYRIDRLLTHWRLAGALQQLAGIGFGSFSGCDDADEAGEAVREQQAGRRFSLEQVLRERTADLGIPVLAGLPVGHIPGNAALPIGARARIDGEQGLLSLVPPAPPRQS